MRVLQSLALALCVCSVAGSGAPSKTRNKPTLANLRLGPNFQWNCQTAAHKGLWNAHAGNCAKLNRTVATYDLIDELDIGVVADFLPDDAARQILDRMKMLPDEEWTQIDNKQARAFGRNKKAYKASVEMDYKMYALQLDNHQEMRKTIEPLFAPYFKGENQKLSLFLGKYSHGSYVTTHTDGAVVTLNGQDRYDRKRGTAYRLRQDSASAHCLELSVSAYVSCEKSILVVHAFRPRAL